jgi:hypothetical protein
MKEALSIVGGILVIFSAYPYLVDIYRKKTKPNIVSWATWTLLTTIATVAAFAADAPRAAFLTLGATIATLSIAILGLKNGIAKLTLFDFVCQAAAIAGLILWLLFNSPTIAIIFSLSIDLIGGLPTLRHSWLKPAEETWQAFLIGGIASILTLLSLEHYKLADLAFPVYFVLFDLIIVVVIVYRRKQKGLTLAR